MKSLIAAAVIVLLASSTASAWTYGVYSPIVVPAPMPYVVNYAPACTTYAQAPVQAYAYRPAPLSAYTVMRPAPVVYAPPVSMFYGPPAVVRYKVYYPGQPVRNVLRAVFP